MEGFTKQFLPPPTVTIDVVPKEDDPKPKQGPPVMKKDKKEKLRKGLDSLLDDDRKSEG